MTQDKIALNTSIMKHHRLLRGITVYNSSGTINATLLESERMTTWPNTTIFATPSMVSEPNATHSGSMPQKFTSFFIAQLVLYLIIILVGASGNFLVLLTIGRIKQMRSVKNFFIGNLATADLITLLLCLPMNLSGYFVSWPFGEFVCQFIFPLTDVVTGSSILTMAAISLDRFRAIVYPFAQKLTLRLTIVVMLLVWALAYIFLGLPLKFAMQLRPGYWVKTSCDIVWPTEAYGHIYRIAVLLCFYLFPVTLILLCYLIIGRKLRENLRFASASVRGNKNLERAKKHKRLTTMMFVIFFSFAVCMLPVNLFFLLVQFHPPMISWEYTGTFYQISALMFFANSAMNPIILALLSREFRRGFRRNCLCLVCWVRKAKPPGFDTFVRKFVNRPPGGYSDVDSGTRYQTEKKSNGTCMTEIELMPLNESESTRRPILKNKRSHLIREQRGRHTNNNLNMATEITDT